MGLDKAIKHGREHRKPYRGAKAVDCTCRNHGSCAYCRGNRLYGRARSQEAAEARMELYAKGELR